MSRDCGTRAKYVIEKCRCDLCRAAARDYERERKRRTEPAYVGADRARQHVRWLSENGVGLKRIVAVSGVSQGCLWKLMYGDERRFGGPSKRIRRDTEQAILAVLPDAVADGSRIDATKTHEHIRTLLARGWSKVAIAKHVHGPEAKGLQVRADTVTAKTARTIAGLLALPVEARRDKYGNPIGVPEPDDQAVRDEAAREEARQRQRAYREHGTTLEQPEAESFAASLDLDPLPEGIDLSWKKQATCARPDFPNYLFFPARGDRKTLALAREACARCPVAGPCLDFALLTNADGVWAGTTEKERRALRKEVAA